MDQDLNSCLKKNFYILTSFDTLNNYFFIQVSLCFRTSKSTFYMCNFIVQTLKTKDIRYFEALIVVPQ